ncbi:unnamed protein product (macronuclear) [Paramecium tetraurelia]|uniref:Cyclic nucleotide-binding domain-containing protein n=1 Tax=Paramecium tetraurelia TaxID=5888 RepID=A0DDP6_PARTE|nr:uncharacterized protein GSPATT00016004001 [Paramecium tetraurelia]CAK81163.1 unnamed protein product [Paramecium tetraurelia]|eukprot:XP_001448560.1 hypothetical protein (macronuclear) [Paramecium tetraurelia strain d4-2]
MQYAATSKCKLMSPQIEQEMNSKGLDNSILEMSPMKIETSNPGISTTQQLVSIQRFGGVTMRINSIPIDTLQPPDLPESDGILSIDKQRENQVMLSKKQSPFAKLIINCHSLKFANKMISFIRPDCKFSQKQHQILNDQASSYMKQKGKISGNFVQQNLNTIDLQIRLKLRTWKNGIVNKLSGCFTQLYNYIPLIEPNNITKLVWDFLLCLIRIYLIMWSPIIISFPFLQNDHASYFLISCVFLAFDLVIRNFTIYFHKGLPVRDRTKLFKKQINFGLAIELGSILFGILVSLDYQLSTWFFILFYYQLRNIMKLVDIIQYNLKPTKMVSSVIDLFKLIATVLLIQHFCGCLWLKLGQYYDSQGKINWMMDVKEESWQVQFLESFYFMSVTMFTVGYGDITPTNSLEKMFCICYMFLSTLQYSYSVNTIGLILTEMKENNEMIRQKMTCINEYLHCKKLSTELSMKVREYFNFYWNQEIIQKKNEQIRLITLLPEDLQKKLKLESASSLIIKCPYFSQFPKPALECLLQSIEFNIFQPGVYVNPQNYIYIIESGKVEVMQEKVVIDTLKENQCFGLQELFSQSDKITYKSADFTSLLMIPRSEVLKVVSKFQLQIIPDKFCYICHDKRHYTHQCNVVHYIPDIEKVIMRYHFNNVQERGRLKQTQKNRTKFYALNEYVLIQGSAKIYQLENDIVPENEIQEQQSQGFSIHQNGPPKINVVTFEDQQVQLNPPEWLVETSFNPVKFMQRTSLLQQTQILDSFKNKRDKKLLLSGNTNKQSDLTVISDKPGDFQEALTKLQYILPKLSNNEYERCFLLIKKLEGELGLTDIPDFEQLREFDKFDREWNIDRIITKLMRPIRKNNTELLNQLLNKYSKYLLFPYEFIRLFRNSLIEEEDIKQNKSYLEQVRHSVRHFLKRKATQVFPQK